ncbi:ER protein translocation subcomplex subunit Sec66 [Schizosaccharomyces japonicus yFS275]|uniref:ER protein translocation subcomplex subunit Sec66 n=1 Tax=Schizosaccharomyces japonicus (strain yFS275 / FY16936) TaxID=402676 RepID=B6K287_SCHJY|nr:ER protein translocation subcomplex subunit Sec66 [Schizosaccharomyces japonicus yFS275]EEB07268.1 ER protein translocation subcomplex subunit Sec66 [Schizosaccharomyces japonicus yFS275]
MLSIYVPIVYVAVLIGFLYGISVFVRKRKPKGPENLLEDWFGPCHARNVFFSVLKQKPPAPDVILKSSLVIRGTEDLKRLLKMKNSRNALNVLINRGAVGDELIQEFTRLEKEMELELMDVARTANTLQEGWNQFFFQSCNEIINNERIHNKLDEIPKNIEQASKRWQQEKAEFEQVEEQKRIQAQKELGVL